MQPTLFRFPFLSVLYSILLIGFAIGWITYGIIIFNSYSNPLSLNVFIALAIFTGLWAIAFSIFIYIFCFFVNTFVYLTYLTRFIYVSCCSPNNIQRRNYLANILTNRIGHINYIFILSQELGGGGGGDAAAPAPPPPPPSEDGQTEPLL